MFMLAEENRSAELSPLYANTAVILVDSSRIGMSAVAWRFSESVGFVLWALVVRTEVFQSLKRGHQEFRRPLLHSSSSALGNLKFLLFFCAFLAELRISCASQVANVFFEDADTKPTVRLNHSEHFREEPQGDAQVRRLSSGLASVTSISFTDTDSTAFRLGGTVSWVAPADLTGIVQYHVRLNWDLSDTVVKTQLFDASLPLPCMCVMDPTTSWVFGSYESRTDVSVTIRWNHLMYDSYCMIVRETFWEYFPTVHRI
eukprot:s80_g2.t4